jgi:hypothetical protein
MACSVCGSSNDDVFYDDEFYCCRCWDNETCVGDFPTEEDISVQKMDDKSIKVGQKCAKKAHIITSAFLPHSDNLFLALDLGFL